MKLASQVVLVVAVVAAVAGGVVLFVRGPTSGNSIELVLPAATSVPETELKVYITGAVRLPGVYAVGLGSRLIDVVDAAGGPIRQADLAAVNLAVRVADEQHWHIPAQGEEPPVATGERIADSGKIDLNSASVESLKSLPGIGDVKALSIVRYRQGNGPFSRVEDVLAVSGIGPATLEAIRELVEVR